MPLIYGDNFRMEFMWFSIKRKITYWLFCFKFLSLKRTWNIILLTVSFYLSRLKKKPVVLGLPWAISAEPCGHCNLHCPECPVGAGVTNRKGGVMAPALFSKILNDAGDELMWTNLYFQGEPMLSPHLPQMVYLALQRNIYTCLSTNSQTLEEENIQKLIDSGLSEIIISMDGFSIETYSKYRIGGSLIKVKESVERLIEKRNQSGKITPFVTVQMVVFLHNQNETGVVKKWCKSAGVDRLNLKQAQINRFGNNIIEPSSIKKHSRYIKKHDGSYEMKQKMYNHCPKQWGSLVIAWNGKVVPCCYDKELEYSPGDINNNYLKNIWKGNLMTSFRAKILTGKKDISICNNCPEGRTFF